MDLPGSKRQISLSVQTLPQGSGSRPRQVFPVACQLARNTLDPQPQEQFRPSGPWSPYVPPQIKPLFFPQQGRLLYFGLSLDGIILSSYCCILKTNTVSKFLRLGGLQGPCHLWLAMRRLQSFLACLILITHPLEAAKEAWESCQKIHLSVKHMFFHKIVFEQSLS